MATEAIGFMFARPFTLLAAVGGLAVSCLPQPAPDTWEMEGIVASSAMGPELFFTRRGGGPAELEA